MSNDLNGGIVLDERSGPAVGFGTTDRTEMKKIKVLIVDDEVAFTNILKKTLELNERYEVCVENHPRLAVVTAREFVPDIVILDVVMPGVDGGEVQAQFKADEVLKDIPIIFLTALVQHQGVLDGSTYVGKPVGADELIGAIEEHFSA